MILAFNTYASEYSYSSVTNFFSKREQETRIEKEKKGIDFNVVVKGYRTLRDILVEVNSSLKDVDMKNLKERLKDKDAKPEEFLDIKGVDKLLKLPVSEINSQLDSLDYEIEKIYSSISNANQKLTFNEFTEKITNWLPAKYDLESARCTVKRIGSGLRKNVLKETYERMQLFREYIFNLEGDYLEQFPEDSPAKTRALEVLKEIDKKVYADILRMNPENQTMRLFGDPDKKE